MKKLFSIIFFAIVFIIVVLNDLDSSPQPDTQKTAKDLTKKFTYSLRATENTWPKVPETASTVADNLLAINYYIVFDGSGSMEGKDCSGNQNKLNAAKKALDVFSRRIPDDANIGLYVFDKDGQSERVTLGPSNKTRFSNAIYQTRADYGTPLRTAILSGYAALTQQAINQLGYGEYHLVIVTDGQASEGEKPSAIVRQILAESPVVVHTIGFCIRSNHSLNQPGLTYYKAANNPQSLQDSLDDVLAEAPNFQVGSFQGK